MRLNPEIMRSIWQTPKSKSVGLFTDLILYYDALKLCNNLGIINLNVLQKELSQRVIGLRYVEQLKARAFTDLLRELSEFKFISQKSVTVKSEQTIYSITIEGIDALAAYETDRHAFLRLLANKMQEIYTVPGWFVNRLWQINPTGQGQVVIPSPLKEWNPVSYKNENFLWNEDLENQVKLSYEKVNSLIPNSFPVNISHWVSAISTEYERLGSLKARLRKNATDSISNRIAFAPRRRLATAMRIASLNSLFGNSYRGVDDFRSSNGVMRERNYMVWCPRLESLEMIYYSDYYKSLPGRLIFPLTVFKPSTSSSDFEINQAITHPEKMTLYYFQPRWDTFKPQFIGTLFDVYQNLHNKKRILYVSLQEVRDEVCRLLRISSLLFEKFLEEAFKQSLLRKIDFSIALETDIREDQRSGSQILRRPVYIQGIPHSLIAINTN